MLFASSKDFFSPFHVRLPAAVGLFLLAAASVCAQNLDKEYIHAGGRLIAVEAPAPPAPAEPTANLSASSLSIVVGQSVTLTWTTANAQSASIGNNIDNNIDAVTPVAGGSKTVRPTANTTYTLTATGAAGTTPATASVTVRVLPAGSLTANLSASSKSIAAGQSVTLTWSTTNAQSAIIDNGVGAVTPVAGGSKTVSPTVDTTYTLTAAGAAGTTPATASVTVEVLAAGSPTATLRAAPASVTAGQSVTLTWSTSNARSATISNNVGNDVGAVTPVAGGSKTVRPTATTTYTLTAAGAAGTTPATASVTVAVAVLQPTAQLRVFPSPPRSIVSGRESATLTWSTSNAQSVTINNGVGAVAASGSMAVSPTATTIYTLTAAGAAGTTPATASVTVKVTNPPSNAPRISWFEYDRRRGNYEFDWSVRNTKRIVITPCEDDFEVSNPSEDDTDSWWWGEGDLSDCDDPPPSAPKTYTLTAYGAEGTTPAVVSATFNPYPSIESFTVSTVWAVSGGAVTLSWETSNALSLSIDNGVGAVTPVADGSVTVRPTQTTAYTLTATGARGTIAARKTVTVKVGIETSLPAGEGEVARIPIVVGNGGVSGNRWWSAQESGVGTLLTPNDLALESGFAVKDFTWSKQSDTWAIGFWSGSSAQPASSRTASTYFGSGGPAHGKSLFVFDGERGYEFAAAATSAAGGGYINWDFTPASPVTAFLDGKTEGAPMLVVIADTGAFPTLAKAVLTGKVAEMDITTGTISAYNSGNSHALYGPTHSTLTAGSDDRIGSTMQIRNLDYHSDTDTVEMHCVPVDGTTQTARDYFSASGEGASKSLYIAAEEGFAEIPYAVLQSSRTSSDGRTVFFDFERTAPQAVFLEALAKRTGAIRFWLLIADPGQKIVTTDLPPTARLTASPLTIGRGRSATLQWNTTNAQSVTIDNSIGAVTPAAAGSTRVTPTETTTYTLTATGVAGTPPVTASVTIVVTEPWPTVELTVFPSSIVPRRQSAVLSWSTTNAQSVTIDKGIGAVTASGSVAVTPGSTTTYTLTATGAEGTPTATARARVTVDKNTPQNQPTVDFFAGRRFAGSYLFEWDVSHTKRIVIDSSSSSTNPVISRSKPESGSWTGRALTSKSSVPTIYTLKAYGDAGTTPATAKVTLNPYPSIESFTASTVWAVSGGAVTLSWETSDALSLNIDNGVGAVKPVASGSVTVRPTETTTYTLTATGVGGTIAARKTVTVKVGIETSLAAGKGEVARIPIVVGNGGASGNRWWSAQESGVGTLLTPNDLTLESDLAVKGVSWYKQADTFGLGLWSGSSTRPVSSRGAVTYFGSGGPASGKSIFVFDGEQGYEFAAAASSAAGHSYINWRLGADSQAAAFLDGKTEGAPMLIVIADTGAYPTLWPAVELSVGRSMPALSGQLARMEIRNVETSAARPYIIFSTSYGGAIASNLLWNDVQEVGDLQYGSDALAQGTNWADRIFYIHYGKSDSANILEISHLAASRNNQKFWSSGGAGYNKSLYFCRVPGGSDFAGASCIEVPYSTLTEAGNPWTHWQFTSGDSRDVFLSSIARGDTVLFAIADPGQTITPTPTAQLTASASTILSGRSAALTWSTTNAQSAIIDNGVGAVTPAAAGSVTVTPAATTTYTLTATGATGTATATTTVKVKTDVDTWLAAGDGEVARIPIVVGNGGASGSRWWSAQESGVGTLLTPNDLALESGFAVKDVTWFKQWDTLAVGFWSGSSAQPASSRTASTYFGSGGPAHGKSVFIFDGEQGYEFAAAATSAAGGGYINWDFTPASPVTAFLDGKTEGTPLLIVIADTGAYPALPPAVELPVGRSMPALSGQLARMEIRNVETSAARPYMIFQTTYGGAVSSGLVWDDINDVGVLQYGSDALVQGTDPDDRIFYIEYGRVGNILRIHLQAASRNSDSFWSSGGAGHNKSLYFCRVPGGSDFAGASCIEVPYSTLTAVGLHWAEWNFTSGDARDAFMKSITRGDTVVFAIADPGQTITPAPAAQLTASTTSILLGQSATLTWSTTRAQSAAIDNGVGAVTPIAAGSTTVTPTATTTYTLTAAGAAGTTPATASVTITVIGPPTAQLTASGSTFVRGRGVRLDWSTTNAQSATIDNGVGVVTPTASGSVHVTTTVTTTYTLTATGAEGMTPATASVTVTVLDPPAALTGEVARMGIAVTPSQTTDASLGISGAATNIWNLYRRAGTHLPSGRIAYGSDDQIGNAARIDRLVWAAKHNSLDLRVTNLSGTTTAGTYFGDSGEGARKSLYFITASGFIEIPYSVHGGTYGGGSQVGDDNHAYWNLNRAAAQAVFLTEFAQRATEQKFWFVIADPGQTISASESPTARLKASGSTFVRGRGVRLDWSTAAAQSATIDNGVGAVTPAAAGSVHVTTTATTTYTLTATGADGTTPATDSVTVTVLDPPSALTGEVARMGIAVTPSQTTDASLGISGAATNVWNLYRRAGTYKPSGKLAYGSDDEIGNAARIDRLIWRTTTDSLILRMTNISGTTTAGTYFRGSGEGTGKSLYFITASGFIELPHSEHDYTYGKTPQVGDDDYAEWDMLNSTAQTAFLTEFAQRATEQKFWFVIADPGQTPAAAQAPTARLTALESSIVRGRSTTLIWSTASAQSAAIDNGIGAVTPAAAGSTTVTPAATTTYTLTATGADGTTPATASITITVTEPPPTAQLTASASSIVRGQSATLNWTTANAQSATIDNGVGAVTPTAAGSTTVTPAAATTYTLTATGAEGTTAATASVTITVIEPPTAQLTASASSVLPGQSTTLTWSAANALSAAIDNGVGAVTPVASGSTTVTPAATTTYTLTATGAAGTTAAAASVTVTVAPLLPAALTGEVARMDITASRPLVAVQSSGNRSIDIYDSTGYRQDSNGNYYTQGALASGGDDVVGADIRIQRIIWRSNDNVLLVRADDSSAADGETDDQAGDYWGAGGAGRNKSVYLAATAGEPLFLEIPASQIAGWTRPGSSFAHWSIPAAGNGRAFMNALAAAGSRPRFLFAVADPGQTITAAGQPTAQLTASASSIVRGRSVTLTWSTTRAQSAAIDNGVGAVTPVASGSTTVTPTATTTYTLTATGATGTIPAMAVVTIKVAQFLPEALTGQVARMDVAPGRPLVASGGRDIDLYDSTRHRLDSSGNAYAQGELAPGGDDIVGADIHIQRITWKFRDNELIIRADDYSATDSETDDQAGDYWGSGGAGRNKSLYLASTAGSPVFLEIPASRIASWTRSGSSFAHWSIPAAGNARAFMNALAAVGSRPRFLFAVADPGQTITVAGIPAAQLTAASSSIVRGQSATLNWTTTNAQSAAIDNGVGAVTPVASGSTTVTPTATTTYTLTATGVSGTTPATASVTITVVEQPTAQLTAAASTIVRGQSATLNWTTVNAQSAAIDNGVGSVTPTAAGSTTVTPTATTTYTLTATGAAGTTAATASITITVTEPPPPAQLTAAASTIVRGQSATLNWTTANAQSATIDNGVGAVTPVASGSTTVTPTATTTYTLTATGAAGTTAATASVTVTVTQWRASLTGQVARMDVTTGALVNAPTLGRVKDIDIYDNTRHRGGVAVGTLASGSDAVVGTDTNIQRITYRTWTTSKSIIIRAADATPGDSETDDQAGEYWASTGGGASKSLYIAATSGTGTPIFIEIPYSQIESGVRNGDGGDFAAWTIAVTGQQADFMEALAVAGNSIHYLFVIADPGQTATTP